MPTTVFVSGCFDLIHGGHLTFLRQARALGERLVVSVAGDAALWQHKRRRPALPVEHRAALLRELPFVDDVLISSSGQEGLDFEADFRRIKPAILAVTGDDRFANAKRLLCEEVGARYIVLDKTSDLPALSSTDIRRRIGLPVEVPLRVDFAGGWLDVPRLATAKAFVVNCAIRPLVSLAAWPYEIGSGLGGSAARAVLEGRSAVNSELQMGVGWQDPAVIAETGLCVWRSGPTPSLALKSDGAWLAGLMAVIWTGRSHQTPSLVDRLRPYNQIVQAGLEAMQAVRNESLDQLGRAINLSYQAQMEEGMPPMDWSEAHFRKYCGGGWGGYVLVLFASRSERDRFVDTHPSAMAVEPYCLNRWDCDGGRE